MGVDEFLPVLEDLFLFLESFPALDTDDLGDDVDEFLLGFAELVLFSEPFAVLDDDWYDDCSDGALSCDDELDS